MSHRPVRPTLLRLSVLTAGSALLLATAVGCGNEADPDPADTASDSSSSSPSSTSSPETSPSDSPTSDPSETSDSSSGAGGELVVGDTVEPGQAVIVSASNVKVEPAVRASALVDDAAIDSFVASTDPQLAAGIRAAAKKTTVPSDSTLFGAVVAVGCDAPTSVTWTKTFDGIEVTPTLPKTQVQCLVPVAFTALFLVPN